MQTEDGYDAEEPLGRLYWRDEILQVTYWMTGEGFGTEFLPADLKKFLDVDDAVLSEILEWMFSSGLLSRAGEEKFALTESGKREGGRRFADEFEEMLKPGHFECDEPDCDCHNIDAPGACKHFEPAAHSSSPHQRN